MQGGVLTIRDQSTSERLAFADVLRGLAAPTVVLGHFIVLYLQAPQVVARITMGEPIQPTAFPAAIDALYSIFNLPGIGVAVFFLISGFVIPLSLDGATIRAYLLKRLLRIFPTYWVALAIGVAATIVSAAFWSKPVTHTAIDYFANTFLIADFFGRLDIISVMWTLQIEVKFYLLAPLFHASLRKGSLWRVLLWGGGVVAAYWIAISGCESRDVAACWGHLGFISRFSWEASFITYMLIGSVLYAHYRRSITFGKAAFGVAFLLACFAAAVPLSSAPALGAVYGLAFLWGFLIFLPAYFFRDRIKLTRPFQFLADISYPLYVVHPLLGYVAMRLMMAAGLPYIIAFPAALMLVTGVAVAIHVYIEAPSIALAKRLARAFSKSLALTPLAEAADGSARQEI